MVVHGAGLALETHLCIRLLGAVVIVAIVVDDHVSVLVVEAGGRDQLPAAAVLREVVAGGTQTGETRSGQDPAGVQR